jgi:hypothetical protein
MTHTLLHRAVLALAFFALGALARPSLVHAQVAVLRIDTQAEPFAREVEAGLQGVGVVADPGYLREARAQSLDPTSDAAIEMITPLLQLRLAVVPLFADDQGIQLEYRDGQSGARLGQARIERAPGGLSAAGREQLRREVVAHLGATIEGSAVPAAVDVPAVDPTMGDVVPSEERSFEKRSLHVRAHAGIGLGMRQAQWPLDGETQRVELGAFASFDLGLSLAFALSDSIALVPAAVYQSALAFQEVEEPRIAAPADKVGVRAHRFAAALGLRFLFDGEGSASLTPALGVGIRNLRPEVHHLSTPAYSLAGPLLQLGLRLPLGDRVALQLVPEAQWLVVGEGLRERAVESSGIGLGGEASIALDVLDALELELSYREAHALLSGAGGSASDAERFMVLRMVGKL